MATVPGGVFDTSSQADLFIQEQNILSLFNKNESLVVDLTQTIMVGTTPGVAVTVAGGTKHDIVIGGTEPLIIAAYGGNDSVIGGTGSDTIIGGIGNDFIMGGPEGSSATNPHGSRADVVSDANTFVFRANSGKDVIGDFDVTKDIIKLRNIDGIETVKDVLKHASQSGDNVVIKLGDGNKITLLNVDLADLKKNPGDHFDVG